MKLRHFVVMLCLLIFSSSAFAYRCSIDMRKIDEALSKNPTITEAQEAEVRKLRAEGEALHKKGKHKESVEALHKALHWKYWVSSKCFMSRKIMVLSD